MRIAEPIAADDPAGNDSDAARVARMLDWLEQQGANFPSLKVETGPHGRKAVALSPIVPGELVIHVPKAAIITLEIAQASATGQQIKTHAANVSDYGYLAAFLLELRREGGFWKPYVDALPQSFPDHPIFLSESELADMNGSYTLPLIREQRNWLAYEHQQIISCLPKVSSFPLRDFAWARCAVMTRAYTLTFGAASTVGLVPLVDMLSHAEESDVLWTGESTYGFSVIATHRIEGGCGVHETYGSRSNARLFVHHGVCLEQNPANDAEIELPALLPAHPFHDKAKDLGEQRGDMRVFRVTPRIGDAAPCAMFTMLRLCCQEDMPGVCRSLLPWEPDLWPVSRKNEVGALMVLAAACRRALAQFNTGLEDDEELMRNPLLPGRLAASARVRYGEKKILHHYLDLATTAIAILQDKDHGIAAHAEAGQPFSDYFASLLPYFGDLGGSDAEIAHIPGPLDFFAGFSDSRRIVLDPETATTLVERATAERRREESLAAIGGESEDGGEREEPADADAGAEVVDRAQPAVFPRQAGEAGQDGSTAADA